MVLNFHYSGECMHVDWQSGECSKHREDRAHLKNLPKEQKGQSPL